MVVFPLFLVLASFHVPVGCAPQLPGPRPSAEGVYLPASGQIVLRQPVCNALQDARAGVQGYTARALHVLGHELAHSYGIANEDGADCVGGLLVGFAGHKLGVPKPVIDYAWSVDQDRVAGCQAWDAHGDTWQAL